jgi:hypothetical protein
MCVCVCATDEHRRIRQRNPPPVKTMKTFFAPKRLGQRTDTVQGGASTTIDLTAESDDDMFMTSETLSAVDAAVAASDAHQRNVDATVAASDETAEAQACMEALMEDDNENTTPARRKKDKRPKKNKRASIGQTADVPDSDLMAEAQACMEALMEDDNENAAPARRKKDKRPKQTKRAEADTRKRHKAAKQPKKRKDKDDAVVDVRSFLDISATETNHTDSEDDDDSDDDCDSMTSADRAFIDDGVAEDEEADPIQKTAKSIDGIPHVYMGTIEDMYYKNTEAYINYVFTSTGARKEKERRVLKQLMHAADEGKRVYTELWTRDPTKTTKVTPAKDKSVYFRPKQETYIQDGADTKRIGVTMGTKYYTVQFNMSNMRSLARGKMCGVKTGRLFEYDLRRSAQSILCVLAQWADARAINMCNFMEVADVMKRVDETCHAFSPDKPNKRPSYLSIMNTPLDVSTLAKAADPTSELRQQVRVELSQIRGLQNLVSEEEAKTAIHRATHCGGVDQEATILHTLKQESLRVIMKLHMVYPLFATMIDRAKRCAVAINSDVSNPTTKSGVGCQIAAVVSYAETIIMKLCLEYIQAKPEMRVIGMAGDAMFVATSTMSVPYMMSMSGELEAHVLASTAHVDDFTAMHMPDTEFGFLGMVVRFKCTCLRGDDAPPPPAMDDATGEEDVDTFIGDSPSDAGAAAVSTEEHGAVFSGHTSSQALSQGKLRTKHAIADMMLVPSTLYADPRAEELVSEYLSTVLDTYTSKIKASMHVTVLMNILNIYNEHGMLFAYDGSNRKLVRDEFCARHPIRGKVLYYAKVINDNVPVSDDRIYAYGPLWGDVWNHFIDNLVPWNTLLIMFECRLNENSVSPRVAEEYIFGEHAGNFSPRSGGIPILSLRGNPRTQ